MESKQFKSMSHEIVPWLGRLWFSRIVILLCLASSASAQTVRLESWQLLPDPSGNLSAANSADAEGWRPVRAGLSWNAQFDDLRDYAEAARYKASFVAPQFSQPSRALLHFGAMNYFSEVFVNGKSVGQHEGGYTPFTFDVTENVRPGRNQILVRVVDPPMNEIENREHFPEWMYNEIPHGKQNWHVQTGGIWQPVSLEVRSSVYIEQVHVTPNVNGDFEIEVRTGGSEGNATHPIPLTVTVRDESGHPDFHKAVEVGSGAAQTIKGHINSPRLWSPDHPVLDSVEVALGGPAEDSVHDRFGFRKFEARNGMLYLNGEPFYMRAALDQEFYPKRIYTPPSEQYVREMMRKGKRLGLNMLRCHIKVPDPLYLQAADEVGMLVWYEIPSWNDAQHFTPAAAERDEKIFVSMVDRDWNHPSIVIQSVDGNCVTNFNWVRANATPFAAVAFSRLMGLESASVVPHYIIEGVGAQDYDDVLSGVFYGWLNQNAALAVQMNTGNGKLLVTTFRFDAYGKDPYATQLDSIIHYAVSPSFAPRLSVVLKKGKE